MAHTIMRPLRNASLLALLFFCGWFGAAKAQSVVYTDTEPIVFANTPYTLTFPQFDPALGILSSAQISLAGGISGTLQYENRNPSAVRLTINVTSTLSITAPNQSSLVAGGPTPILTTSDLLASFDGSVDFGGPSGRTKPFTTTVASAKTYSSTADLQPFLGTGQINLPLHLQGGFTAGGATGNVAIVLTTNANAVGAVRYVYAKPSIALQKLTNGFDANGPNDPDVPQIQPGAPVTWTYIVTNTSAVTLPLASVVLTDSQPGVTPVLLTSSDVNGDNLLSPGEVWRFQATGTAQTLTAPGAGVTIVPGCNPTGGVTPGNRPTYENIGQVTIPGATASDPSHYCNPAPGPGIAIQKRTNSFDANGPNDPDVPQLQPGATVTWTYIVTNTGNISFPLASVIVTDSQPGITPTFVTTSDANGDGFLAPGETWLYQATSKAQNLTSPSPGVTVVLGCNPSEVSAPGARPTYENIGQVRVPGATASDPSHYCNPPTAGILLQKTVYQGHNGGAACPGGEVVNAPVDTPITYCFAVTNTSQTFLSSFVFTDTDLGINLSNLTLRSGSIPLAPGAALVYFYETTLQKNLVNTAAVQATPTDSTGTPIPGLSPVTAQDIAQVLTAPTALDLLYLNIARQTDSVGFTWAKALAQGTIGFHVYRSTTAQRSGAVQVDSQLAVGRVDTNGDLVFRFTDPNTTPDATYYYWLVDVKVDGSTDESDAILVKPQSAGQSYQLFLPQVNK
ncbi:MAG: choice-of-anchor E domain-containing protein [Caldilineaceae bacterium]